MGGRTQFPPLLSLFLVPIVLDPLNPHAFGFPMKEGISRGRKQPGEPAEEGNEQREQQNASLTLHRSLLFWSLVLGVSLGFGAWDLALLIHFVPSMASNFWMWPSA